MVALEKKVETCVSRVSQCEAHTKQCGAGILKVETQVKLYEARATHCDVQAGLRLQCLINHSSP